MQTDSKKYKQNQNFNPLVSWLHSKRFNNVLDVLDKLPTNNKTINILDIGCAHAGIFPVLNERYSINYTGVEAFSDYYEAARQYETHENFSIKNDFAENYLVNASDTEFDIIIALETFQHIPEHTVVRIIERITSINPKLFLCSVPVEIGLPLLIKNFGSWAMGYNRHKEYNIKETLYAGLYFMDKIPPHGIGYKGFDWRWFAQTIRHNLKIIHFKKMPFNFLPSFLNTSVFIAAAAQETHDSSDIDISIHPFTKSYHSEPKD